MPQSGQSLAEVAGNPAAEIATTSMQAPTTFERRFRPRFRIATMMLLAIPAAVAALWARDRYLGFSGVQWQTYTPALLDQRLSEGKIVLVHFHANWSVASVLQRAILEDIEVRHALRDEQIVSLEADWTKNSPVIRSELQRLGEAENGVPVLAIFQPAKAEPTILPDDATAQEVIAAVKAARKAHTSPKSSMAGN